MDSSKIPEDLELKNIIQKLANFVARNGPEFEKMTKEKQKDNPKFSFLFSGEFHAYYNYCVMTEKAALQHQMEVDSANRNNSQWSVVNNQNWSMDGSQQWNNGHGWQQMHPTPPQQMPPAPPQQFMNQMGTMPNNAQADWQQSIQQLKDSIEEKKKEMEKQVKESELNLHAQYLSITQQQQNQIEAEILAARKCELKRLSDDCGIALEEIKDVIQPIIESCTKDAIANGKNWIIQHWTLDKNSEFINKYLIDRIIDSNATFSSRLHLIYLINDILHNCVRKQIDDLKSSLEEHIVVPSYCITFAAAGEEDRVILNKLLGLWENNKYLSEDTIKVLTDPTEGLNKFQAQLATAYESIVVKVTTEMTQQYQNLQQQHQNFVKHIQQEISNSEKQLNEMIESAIQQKQQQSAPPFIPPIPNFQTPADIQQAFPNPMSMSMPDFSRPPPGFPPMPPPPGFMPMNSFQPPRFGAKPPCDVDILVPSMPYFDLPAGLMAPLVKLENSEYEPLDPKLIRLPPPMPPTERLLAAVEAFYAPPNHDRPRDQDGWEKLGLFEFFRAKQIAKKNKIQNIRNIRVGRGGANIKSKSKSPPGFRRKREPSPVDYKRASRSPSRSSSSSSDSRSRSASNSRSSSRSRSRSRGRRQTRSRSRSVENNVSQPFYQSNVTSKLSEDNKGHQLLTKMGWSGGGLGQDGAGIVDPIEAGDVRDKSEQFMGLGNQSDPFDQFRKNRSVGFNIRMKEKAIAREKAEAKNLAATINIR